MRVAPEIVLTSDERAEFQSKSDILVEICERSTRGALAAAENAMSTKDSPQLRFERFLREFTNVALHQIEDPRIGALVIAGMSSYAFAWYREHGRHDQQEVTDRIVRMDFCRWLAANHGDRLTRVGVPRGSAGPGQ